MPTRIYNMDRFDREIEKRYKGDVVTLLYKGDDSFPATMATGRLIMARMTKSEAEMDWNGTWQFLVNLGQVKYEEAGILYISNPVRYDFDKNFVGEDALSKTPYKFDISENGICDIDIVRDPTFNRTSRMARKIAGRETKNFKRAVEMSRTLYQREQLSRGGNGVI